jgi:hypothetical protein
MFADEVTMALHPGDIIGTFNSSDECFGMAEYEGIASLYKLIAMGNDPYSRGTDGFNVGESMRFKLYRPDAGISMDITLEFDPEYPNYDGSFEPNGVSRILGFTMAVTSVNDMSNSNHINIFPNPAVETVNITSGLNMLEITMLNHIGQKIMYRKVRDNAIQLNVSKYPMGIYFLRIGTNDGSIITKRIIIE